MEYPSRVGNNMLGNFFSLPPVSAAAAHQAVHTAGRPITGSIGYQLLPKKFGSIIKTLPHSNPIVGDLSYNELTCTEEDVQNIAFILTTMAENGKLALLLRTQELRRIGDAILHVHPFRFLGLVFANPTLKTCIKEISNDYFKWGELMGGIGVSLTAQADRGKLDCYLNDFAKEIDIDPALLQGFIASRSWENLVAFLMSDNL